MQFWQNIWNDIVSFFTNNLWNIILFFSIAIFGVIAIKIVLKVIRKIFKKAKLEITLANFLCSLIKFVLLIVYVITLLSIIGVPITSLVAVLTALSLAVALAVQSFLSSLAYGLIMLFGKLFKEGEYVEIDGVGGTVQKISMLNTVLKTPNGQIVTVPHSKTSSAVVTNYSQEQNRRIDISVCIEYDCDIQKTKSTLENILISHPNVLQDMQITVAVKEFGENGMIFAVRAFTSADKYFDTLYAINETILFKLRKSNIKIPYNTITVKSD